MLPVLALLSVALVSLSACGDDDHAVSSATMLDSPAAEEGSFDMAGSDAGDASRRSAGGADAESAMTEEAPAKETGTDGASLAVPTALTTADLGREIVYRATISVQADDVTTASNEAMAIV